MSLESQNMVRYTDGENAFIIDLDRAPLLVTSWCAEPTVELVLKYTQWSERFVAECRQNSAKFAIVADLSDCVRPGGDARALLAKVHVDHDDVFVVRVAVANSATVRGALTAISWLTGKRIPVLATRAEGIRAAEELLAEAGISFVAATDLGEPAPKRRFRFFD